MTRNQEWVNNKLKENGEEIEFKYGKFEGFLEIRDQEDLKSIDISNVKSIDKLTLDNLANLEECRVYNCILKDLIIENCPRLNSLIVSNNLLVNLDFAKKTSNLISLDIDGNERISIGVEHLSDSLEKFSCEGTELFNVLEKYEGDWRKYKQYLQEENINEEENIQKELSSFREENKLLSKKYKILKDNVSELKKHVEEKLSVLSNSISNNDPKTKEMLSDLRKSIENITDENTKLKEEIEHLKPLFDKSEPIIEINKKSLGRGNYGEVHKGIWKTQIVAVKKHFSKIEDEKERTEIRKELKILKNLRSNYIIQYYGEYQKEDNIYIVMEYAEHGSLTKFIEENKNQVNYWDFGYDFIRNIAKGLRYLHSERVLHRDLKSHNVLITEGYVAKLADFGLAKLLESSYESSDGKKIKGTPRWLAPEALRSEKHSFKSDIYSLGVVMWEVVAQETLPFKQFTENWPIILNVGNNGLREIIPIDTSEQLKKIIQGCWKENPQERISLESIESQLNELIIKEESQLETVIEVKTN